MIKRQRGTYTVSTSVSLHSFLSSSSFPSILTESQLETMQWSHPITNGDIPPPSRAHTATLVDRKIYVFGGGQAASYSDSVYILDTVTRKWTKPIISGAIRDPNTGEVIGSAPGPPGSGGSNHSNGTNSRSSPISSTVYGEIPAPRRAHTAVYYNGKIWMFGGGNGMMALNDVWTLDVSKMIWERMNVRGRDSALSPEDYHDGGKGGRYHGLGGIPSPRGYHTANLVGNMMIIVGGSDGKDCFAEIWCLNLGKFLFLKLSPLTLTYSWILNFLP